GAVAMAPVDGDRCPSRARAIQGGEVELAVAVEIAGDQDVAHVLPEELPGRGEREAAVTIAQIDIKAAIIVVVLIDREVEPAVPVEVAGREGVGVRTQPLQQVEAFGSEGAATLAEEQNRAAVAPDGQ